jgi:hypothetical protein
VHLQSDSVSFLSSGNATYALSHIGKLGFSALFRHLLCVKERAAGRLLQIEEIAMPALANACRGNADVLAVDFNIEKYQHFGVIWKTRTGVGADSEDTKPFGERPLLLKRYVLVSKEQNIVLQPSAADICNYLIRELFGQIEPDYLCPQCIAKRFELNAHSGCPSSDNLTAHFRTGEVCLSAIKIQADTCLALAFTTLATDEFRRPHTFGSNIFVGQQISPVLHGF